MRTAILALASILAAAGAAAAQPTGPERGRPDRDRDGLLSLSEMQAHALDRFDRADLDRDGRLTPQERQARHAARSERHVGRGAEHQARRQFAVRDPDRVITRAEVEAGVQARFARVDTDRDGFVTREERRAAYAARRQAG